MARNLTQKQEDFCVQYIVSQNATEAYRRVYGCDKSKPSSVHRRAKEMIDNSRIAARIRELQRETADKLLISDSSVLKEHARIAFADIRRIFNGRKLKDIADLDDDTAAAVSSVKVIERPGKKGEIEYVHEIKMWPKNSALDSLSRHLGLFAKDNAQNRPLVNLSVKDFTGDAPAE